MIDPYAVKPWLKFYRPPCAGKTRLPLKVVSGDVPGSGRKGPG